MTIRHAYADTPLGQLHYAESGEGPSVVLALHQTPRSHDEFREVLPLLAHHRRAIAMDMYGFGASAKPSGQQTIEQYADGVLALTNALGVERFALLGHHTGAVVAVEVAARRPDSVSALVLSSPAYTNADYRHRHTDGPGGIDDAPTASDGSHLTTWWAQRAPYYPAERPDLLDRFVRDALAPDVDPLEGHLACTRYLMEDRIDSVSAPTLVLGAAEDPFGIAAIEPVRAALVGVPRLDVEILAGGTIPLMEQLPNEVAAVVTRFLDDIGV